MIEISADHQSSSASGSGQDRHPHPTGAHYPAELSRDLAAALTPEALAQMGGAAPAICLDTWLGSLGTNEGALTGQSCRCGAPPVNNPAGLRYHAARRIALGGHASLYSDMALDALGALALCHQRDRLAASNHEVGGNASAESPSPGAWPSPCIHTRAREYLAEYVGRYFSYLAQRHLVQAVGTAALPTIPAACAARKAVESYCRGVLSEISLDAFGEHLCQALTAPSESARIAQVSDSLTSVLNGAVAKITEIT